MINFFWQTAKSFHGLALILLLVLLASCSINRKLQDNEYLLQKQEIEVQGKYPSQVTKGLSAYYQQTTNSPLLVKEWVYTAFHNEKGKKLRNWVSTNLGQKPVIYDRYKTKKTNRQFELYLQNKGYLNASVSDSVHFDNEKAYVTYKVNPKAVYRIDTVMYTIPDSTIRRLYFKHLDQRLVKAGKALDVDLLKKERGRIADMLKQNGFYFFNKQYVSYVIDTAYAHRQVKVNIQIKRPAGSRGHKRYKIDSVFIYPNYDPNLALKEGKSYFQRFDTLPRKSMEKLLFLRAGDYTMRQSALLHENFIFPDSLYTTSETDRTYRQLLGLGAFKFVNIDYQVSPRKSEADSWGYLNCYIQLTPMVKQSYSLNVEGTNTSGNFGVAGNLSYEHKNFLNGAENFKISLKGAQEAQGDIVVDENQEGSIQLFNTQEYGLEAGLQVPRFLFPFMETGFSRRYNPFTSLRMAYNYQKRPDYTRSIIKTTFGYKWTSPGNRMINHFLNPLQLNMVSVPDKSADFLENIQNPYILNSYENQFIFSTGYSLVYDNQEKKKSGNNIFFRTNIESAGNVLNLFSEIADARKVESYYELSGIRYAQYLKFDVDFRYYQKIDKQNKMVYRLFAGITYPYGNSGNSTPFIKKYYAGGANSLRAWPVRGVGPGTYSGEVSGINNQLGDVKLEANFEYRFDLFWIIEGALFMDMGNIWELPKSAGDEAPAFHLDSFHNGIAMGTGFGTRFDLSFFVLRLDLGLKLRDPAEPEGQRWLPGSYIYKLSDFTLNFGISYPF